jgi:hypothetical protein
VNLKHLWGRIWGIPPAGHMAAAGIDRRTKDWFPAMLQSRKFRQLLFVDALVLLFAYTIVAVWGVHDSSVMERALQLVERVTISYFGLNVAQKGVETWGRVRGMKPSADESAGEDEV